MEKKIYDKTGREILVGDVLKLYHFTGARRKQHYMYKQVTGIRPTKSGAALLEISHLNLKAGTYHVLKKGQILPDYEIVQGYGNGEQWFFDERTRKKP